MSQLKRLIFFLVFGGSIFVLKAQNSPIQSASGETSLTLNDANQVVFNFAKSEVGIGFNKQFDEDRDNKSYFLGVNSKFEVSSSISNLIKKEKFGPNGSIGFTIGRTRIADREEGSIRLLNESQIAQKLISGKLGTLRTIAHWWYAGLNVEAETFKLYNNETTTNLAVLDSGDIDINFIAGYNRIGAVGKNQAVWGLSIKPGLSNNTGQISDIEIISSTERTDANGTIIIETSRKKTTGQLSSYNPSLKFLKLNFDYLFYLDAADSKIAFGPSIRADFRESVKPQYDAIFGIYLSDAGKGNSLKINGGIQYQWTDLGNYRDSSKTVREKSVLNLVVGYFFLRK